VSEIKAKNDYVGIERLDDPCLTVYHSRVRLLDDGWQIQSGYKGVEYIAQDLPIGSVLEFILSLPGVEAADVKAYRAIVRKGLVFEWDEIDRPMVDLLLGVQLACSETDPVEIERTRLRWNLPYTPKTSLRRDSTPYDKE